MDIVIADSRPVVTDGLAQWIRTIPDTRVSASAADVHATCDLILQTAPTLAVLGDTLEGGSAMDVVRSVKSQGSQTSLVILSSSRDPFAIKEAIVEGAEAFVSIDCDQESFAAAIGAAATHTTYIDPSVSMLLVNDEVAVLTPAERLVLRHVVDGQANKQIAIKLAMSTETVSKHVSSIMRKLDAQNRTGAVATAFRLQLVS